MLRSESINELATALAKAQGTMGAAKKDANNPFFKSKYADLASVVEAIKTPLSANGLSYTQLVGSDDQSHYIETLLMHTSGQWLSERVKIVVTKPNDPQSFGSAVTYFRRYSLQSILGVPADDDDANAASGKRPGEPKAKADEKEEVEIVEVVTPEARLRACGSLAALKEVWESLTREQRKELAAVKDDCRLAIIEAERVAESG